MGNQQTGKKNKLNKLDIDLKLPIESNKNVCKMIRNLLQKEENEDITEEFLDLTDLDRIEEQLFGTTNNMEHEYFIIRLYVKHNVLETSKQKFIGRFASLTQELGSCHVAIQVAEKVVHWFNSSFAFIKDWKGEGATAVFYPQNKDGAEVPAFKNTKESRLAISKIIQEWNCKKMYNSKDANCQIFSREIFKVLGLEENFSSYQGFVGDYINYISEFKHSVEQVNPCLISKGKVIVSWESHEELDNWHIENIENFMDASSLVKAFHRAYQMKGEVCQNCPLDAPTLLIDNNFEKLPVHQLSGYSNSNDSKMSVSSKISNSFSGN